MQHTMTTLDRVLEKLLKVGLYAVPFLPLLVFESLFFPFITTKNFLFRIIVEVLLVAWVILAVRHERFRPRKSWITYALGAFFVVLLAATVFSIDPVRSFFSNAERMEGAFGLLHFLVYFFLLTNTFQREKDWLRFFWVTIGVSLLMALHGVGQLMGLFEIHQGGVRLDATMGNATYLAIYMVFHIFLLGYLFTKYRHLWLRVGIVAAALLEAFILYNTATRGAILGLIGGALVFGLLTALFSRGRARRWAIGVLAVFIILPLVFLAVQDSSFVQDSPVLARFANISPSEQTTESRFIIWGMAVDAALERPVLGWGPENFTYIFAKEYEPELWRQEPWFDRAHNVFLDWFTATGALGLIAYLSIFTAALWSIWRLYKKDEGFTAVQASLFVGMLAAYFFHNLFVFDNMTSYLLFFSVLGYLHYRQQDTRYHRQGEAGKIQDTNKPQESGETKNSQLTTNNSAKTSSFGNLWGRGIAVVVALLVVWSLWAYNIQSIRASQNIVQALVMASTSPDHPQHSIAGAHATLKTAIERDTFMTTEVREQTAQWAQRVFTNPQEDQEAAQDLITFATQQQETQIKEHPFDMRAKAFLAGLYTTTQQYGKTVALAQRMIDIAPQRQQFYFFLAEAQLRAGNTEKAVEAFGVAFELDPSYDQARRNYALALIYNGDIQEAEAVIEEEYGSSFIADERFATAYVFQQNFAKVAGVWERIVEERPEDAQAHLNLAQAYARAGQNQQAIAEIRRVIELAPGFAEQGQQLIQDILNGTVQF